MDMEVKEILIVTDGQYDFINGTLGSKEAEAAVPRIVKKIDEFPGDVYTTQDTHDKDYLSTHEGKMLPIVHTVLYSHGWEIHADILAAVKRKMGDRVVNFMKSVFGCSDLCDEIGCDAVYRGANLRITVIGYCTDICVINNVVLLRTWFPEAEIIVDAACCAGVTPELHKAALMVMKSFHTTIINEEEAA